VGVVVDGGEEGLVDVDGLDVEGLDVEGLEVDGLVDVDGLGVDGLVDVDGEVDEGGAPDVAAPVPVAPDAPPDAPEAPPDCACDAVALARAKVTAIAM
jgi:hypothetical protein